MSTALLKPYRKIHRNQPGAIPDLPLRRDRNLEAFGGAANGPTAKFPTIGDFGDKPAGPISDAPTPKKPKFSGNIDPEGMSPKTRPSSVDYADLDILDITRFIRLLYFYNRVNPADPAGQNFGPFSPQEPKLRIICRPSGNIADSAPLRRGLRRYGNSRFNRIDTLLHDGYVTDPFLA